MLWDPEGGLLASTFVECVQEEDIIKALVQFQGQLESYLTMPRALPLLPGAAQLVNCHNSQSNCCETCNYKLRIGLPTERGVSCHSNLAFSTAMFSRLMSSEF